MRQRVMPAWSVQRAGNVAPAQAEIGEEPRIGLGELSEIAAALPPRAEAGDQARYGQQSVRAA
jgi:hypothetical protein